jgi:hypothetical protein
MTTALRQTDLRGSSQQPWDELEPTVEKSLQHNKRRFSEELSLDDGDLPSLTPRKQQASELGLRGQQRTLQDLRPPNLATLSPSQRIFWGQLEQDNDDEDEEPVSVAVKDQPQQQLPSKLPSREQPSQLHEFVEVENEDGDDTTFCGQTLHVLGDICGSPTDTEHAVKVTTSDTVMRPKVRPAQEVEEHTAIEVEFVEPAVGSNANQRSAYLNDMARQAKEAFKRNKAATANNDTATEQDTLEPSDTNSRDVYQNFSATEKRFFLKLINAGVSPAEASARVKDGSSNNKRRSPEIQPQTPTKKLSKLAFWKTSPTAAAAPVVENVAEEHAVGHRQVEQQEELRQVEMHEEVSMKEEASRDEYTPPRAVLKPAPSEAHDVDRTAPESLSSEEDAAGTSFAKSGINYYDAVHQEEQPDEDEPFDELLEQGVTPSGTSSKVKQKKPRGFLNLVDNEPSQCARNRSYSAPSLDDDNSFTPERRSFDSSDQKDVESSMAGTLAMSDERKQRMPDALLQDRPAPTSHHISMASLLKKTKKTDDAESNDIIEKELLRPLRELPSSSRSYDLQTRQAAVRPPIVSPASTATNETPKKESVYQQHASIAVVSPLTDEKRRPTSPQLPSIKLERTATVDQFEPVRTRQPVTSLQIDTTDMGAYFQASVSHTPSNSVAGNATHDGMSVFTSTTGTTAYTFSSRVRRPGAAKYRLAQAKQTTKKDGWHETMRAAAANTNLRWDAKRGWIDYEDKPAHKDTSNEGKIHLNLSKSITTKNQLPPVIEQSSEPVDVPFPEKWKQQRNEMIAGASFEDDASHMPRYNGESSLKDSTVKTVDSSEDVPLKMTPNQSWVNSMRIASQALAKDGKVWDQDRGWQSKKNPDSVDFDEAPHVSRLKDATLLNSSEIPLDRQAPRHTYTKARQPSNGDKKLNELIAAHFIDPKGESFESSNLASTSAASDPDNYLQLADSGAVHAKQPPTKSQGNAVIRSSPLSNYSVAQKAFSTRSDNYMSGDEDDYDSSPLQNDSGPFPPVTSGKNSSFSAMTNVVKQKIGKEERDLFDNNKQPDVQVFPHHDAKEVSSRAGSRSVSGPVDLDDSDIECSSDSDEEDTRKGIDTIGKSASVVSSTLSGLSKPVPKLRRSQRDTSPIQLRTEKDRKTEDDDERMESKYRSVEEQRRVEKVEEMEHVEQPSELPDEFPERMSELDWPGECADEAQSEGGFNQIYMPTITRSADKPREEMQLGNVKPRRPLGSPSEALVDPLDVSVSESNFANALNATDEPIVKARLRQWENLTERKSRSTSSEASAEWKSFLGKKVSAETLAAKQHQKTFRVSHPESDKHVAALTQQKELVQVKEPEGDKYAQSSTVKSNPNTTTLDAGALLEHSRSFSRSGVDKRTHLGSTLSELSPVALKEEESEYSESDEVTVSDAYGPKVGERGGFFKRMIECAAPVMSSMQGRDGESSMPLAHLAFLRSNPHAGGSQAGGAGLFVPPSFCGRTDGVFEDKNTIPPTFCGRPDGVFEEKESEESDQPKKPVRSMDTKIASLNRPRAQSARRIRDPDHHSSVGASSSSVVSEDFGAKTAYLEAIAMKTAVSQPRRSSRNRGGRSSSSTVSLGSNTSSAHTEKWKSFLEKKRQAGHTMKAHSTSDVSKAAEKYAAKKAEEMKSVLSAKNKIEGKRYEVASSHAAEDLAAARVEAMMAALSSSHLNDEGEI